MHRFRWMVVSLLLVVVLMAAEVFIIKSASKYEPQVDVVFAKTRIAEGTSLSADLAEIRKVGISNAHRQSIRNIGDLEGRKAGMDIEAGEMLLSAKLRPEGMEAIKVRDRSKRLFSVEFKGDQANGWWLMTDQQVDIIFIPNEMMNGRITASPPAAEGAKPNPAIDGGKSGSLAVSGVLRLRNIRIAAMMDDRGQLLKNTGRQTLPKYISFEVTDAQADFLAYAKGAGRLELALIPDS